MSKEFVLGLAALGGLGYFFHTKDPAYAKKVENRSAEAEESAAAAPSQLQKNGTDRPRRVPERPRRVTYKPPPDIDESRPAIRKPRVQFAYFWAGW